MYFSMFSSLFGSGDDLSLKAKQLILKIKQKFGALFRLLAFLKDMEIIRKPAKLSKVSREYKESKQNRKGMLT